MAWTYLVWLGLLYLVAWPGLDYLDYLDYFLAWTLASVLYLISDRDASDVCRCFCSWLDDNSLRGFWDLGESRNKKKWNGVEWNCPSHYCKLANGTFSGGCQETPNGEFPGVPNKGDCAMRWPGSSMVSGSHLDAMFAYDCGQNPSECQGWHCQSSLAVPSESG